MSEKKPAFVQRMTLNGFDLTSIVCDQDEFNENIDSLKDVFCANLKEKASEDQIALIKKVGHLPLCSKGTKTIHLFEKYNVETDKLAMIIRGRGPELLKRLMKP